MVMPNGLLVTLNYTQTTNESMRGNTTVLDGNSPVTVAEWLLVVGFILIMCTGMVGNAFVIYVFGYKRSAKRRTTTDQLILYLGIIDCLSSMFNPPLYIYWIITRFSRWDFGELGCTVIPALGPIMTSASAGILLIFAIDRYMAIVTPFYGELSHGMVTIASAFNIALSALAYTHYMNALTISPSGYCHIPNVAAVHYGIPNCILIVIRLIIFASVFSFTNWKIFQTLKTSSRTSTVRELRILRHKQSRRVMLVLLTMGIVFTLLVFPRELFYLFYNMSWLVCKEGIRFNQTSLQINSWLKVMHTANSCANVFIYSHMQTIYRKQIFRVFSYFGCCKNMVRRQEFVSQSQTTMLRPSTFVSRQQRKTKSLKNDLVTEKELVECLITPDEVFFKRAKEWKKDFIGRNIPLYGYNTTNI